MSETTRAEVIHLRSQEGQPYGSVCRCCTVCGVMLCGPTPRWVEFRGEYDALPPGFIRCGDVGTLADLSDG